MKNSNAFELFVFDGHLPKISGNMQKPDKHFPPNNILGQGSKAIRSYWNMKNLRRRKNEQT